MEGEGTTDKSFKFVANKYCLDVDILKAEKKHLQ